MSENQESTNICPICGLSFLEQSTSCFTCGFDVEVKEILDREKTRSFISSIPRKDWVKKIRLKKTITDIQIKKHGFSSTNPKKGGWSNRKTADLLGETNACTSPHIKLAEKLDEYPELQTCKNIREAQKRLSQIETGGSIIGNELTIDYEKDLQSYISKNWENISLSSEWILQKPGAFHDGRYNTGEVGQMDFLARHKTEAKWLVIELKRDQSSDETVGQILRYMGWIKSNLAKEDENVEGIIISRFADAQIKYALLYLPNVDLKIYKFHKGELEFEDGQYFFLKQDLKQLSQEQRSVLLEKLKGLKEY